MSVDTLRKYLELFGSLHQNRNPAWGRAPHKPILLLAVLDEIERSHIQDSLLALTPELVAAFRAYWRVLVPPHTWQEKIVKPFRFMVQEGFWELVKNGVPVSTRSLGDNPTIRQLTVEVDGARLAGDLWQLLQDRTALHALRAHVLHEYFDKRTADVQAALPDSPMDYEAAKLRAESQSKFKIKPIRETNDETGYYVRHALFPKVIKSLYNDTCAVCGLRVINTDNGHSLVDAAHIMPFGLFHNDDPRNGMALCKNHHWGFDAGWFSVTDTYRVTISPRIGHVPSYLISDAPLLLPAKSEDAPAVDALLWHRSHVFRE